MRPFAILPLFPRQRYGDFRSEILRRPSLEVQGRLVARGDFGAGVRRSVGGDGLRRRYAVADHVGETGRRILRAGQGVGGDHQHPLQGEFPLSGSVHLRSPLFSRLDLPQSAALLAGLRNLRPLLRELHGSALYRHDQGRGRLQALVEHSVPRPRTYRHRGQTVAVGTALLLYRPVGVGSRYGGLDGPVCRRDGRKRLSAPSNLYRPRTALLRLREAYLSRHPRTVSASVRRTNLPVERRPAYPPRRVALSNCPSHEFLPRRHGASRRADRYGQRTAARDPYRCAGRHIGGPRAHRRYVDGRPAHRGKFDARHRPCAAQGLGRCKEQEPRQPDRPHRVLRSRRLDGSARLRLREKRGGTLFQRRGCLSGCGGRNARLSRRAVQFPARMGVRVADLPSGMGTGRLPPERERRCRGSLRRPHRRREDDIQSHRERLVGAVLRRGDREYGQDRQRAEYEDRDRRHPLRRRVAILHPADAHRQDHDLYRPIRQSERPHFGLSGERRVPQDDAFDRCGRQLRQGIALRVARRSREQRRYVRNASRERYSRHSERPAALCALLPRCRRQSHAHLAYEKSERLRHAGRPYRAGSIAV